MDINFNSTICALSTVQGKGAIAVIRVTGENSIIIVDSIFKPLKGKPLSETPGNRVRYGSIYDGDVVIDEVLVSLYRTPHSYTGENMAEISCHGSQYIQQEILMLLLSRGAKLAAPGEFSKRAFLNGKMDLAQAEAVADLISSETEASHRIAMQQMKGGFSKELSQMRASLLEIVSLMELELDFSDEDVEFADRDKLLKLVNSVDSHITKLIESFKLGNVIKNGIPVAIAGATNTGKSTLLNAFLDEERAIVSDIHGTTRDFIEGFVNIDGVGYRFIDTAGIRETQEFIEIIGIERSFEKIKSSSIVLLVLDSERENHFESSIQQLSSIVDSGNQKVVIILNKSDIYKKNNSDNGETEIKKALSEIKSICIKNNLATEAVIPVSAKEREGLEMIKETLIKSRNLEMSHSYSTLVTNIRHYEALREAKTSLERVKSGLSASLPTDLLAQDIREVLYHIGEIVGEINTEEILGNIFSKFCIGK